MNQSIRTQILQVRDSGKTNMLDINGVMYVANQLQLFDLVCYLVDHEHHREYCKFIMTGEDESQEGNMTDSGNESFSNDGEEVPKFGIS